MFEGPLIYIEKKLAENIKVLPGKFYCFY